MNKFTKIKKALAVSLCSSMLFSGALKTSGMDDELIKNLTQQVSSLTQQVADLSKENIGKAFGISVGQALTYAPIAYVLEELLRNSIIMCRDCKKTKEIYKKACYFLHLFNAQNLLNNVDDARRKLSSARTLALLIEHNNDSWFDYFLRSSTVASAVKSDKDKSIKKLAEVFPNINLVANNEDLISYINAAGNVKNPEGSIEKAFDLMKGLPGFDEAMFNQYVNNVNLPTVQEVLP
jgi:hypothetical protein